MDATPPPLPPAAERFARIMEAMREEAAARQGTLNAALFTLIWTFLDHIAQLLRLAAGPYPVQHVAPLAPADLGAQAPGASAQPQRRPLRPNPAGCELPGFGDLARSDRAHDHDRPGDKGAGRRRPADGPHLASAAPGARRAGRPGVSWPPKPLCPYKRSRPTQPPLPVRVGPSSAEPPFGMMFSKT